VTIVETLARLAAPWADAYGDSKWLMNAVTFGHVAAFLLAGGFALASDRAVLHAAGEPAELQARRIADLASVHRPVLVGLALAALTGMLLFLSDVETFAVAPVFWVKMAFLVLLLVNGSRLRAQGRRLSADGGDERAWRTLRRLARWSSILWLVAVLTGVMLVNL